MNYFYQVLRLGNLFTAALLLTSVHIHAQEWRDLDQESLLYLQLDTGLVVIELNSAYAPKTVSRIKQLTRSGFYRGTSFYRVIDGFVAQGGAEEEGTDNEQKSELAALPMEAYRPIGKKDLLTSVQSPDMFAPHTFYIDGFAAGAGSKKSPSWLLHCPGTVGMSRGNEPDTATTDFYVVIGQAPRYLDGIMTLFGQVVWGMDRVQKINRGPAMENGIIQNNADRTHIQWAAIGADLAADQQLLIQVEDTNTQAFREKLIDRRQRPAEFFYQKPPPVLDICQVPIYQQIKPAEPRER